MQMIKKLSLSALLCALTIGMIPTQTKANHTVSYTALATLLVASPIILIYLQDLLPEEITNSSLFKNLIGSLEKDPDFKITGMDADVIKGHFTDKKPATGLVGRFHASFIKPLKKITDDCKLVRDTALFIATLIVLDKAVKESVVKAV